MVESTAARSPEGRSWPLSFTRGSSDASQGMALQAWLVESAAILGYGIVTLAFLWRIAVLGLVPFGYDLLTYFYPYKSYLAELVRQGNLPLWNPMIFMGAPLLGNIQAAVLYPPDLLFYLMPTVDALRYSVVLHVFLAAALTYAFARVSLRLSPMASWLAGAVFAFGGFIGAHVGQINQLHAAVWLPPLMMCLEQASSRRSARAAAVGATLFAVQVLAGHTQEVYYTALALGLFALYLAAFDSKGRRAAPILALVAIGFGAAMLSAVQLVPTLELARESYRSGGIPFGEAVTFSVSPKDLLGTVLPLYAYAPYVEVAGYTGVVSLVLIPAALAYSRRPPAQWFFACLGALALLLSLGDSTPLYGWLFGLVPGFDLFRAPGRWLFLYTFSVAVLAGFGVDAVRSAVTPEKLSRWMNRYGLILAAGVAVVVGLRLWLESRDQEFQWPHPRIVFTWATVAGAGVGLSLLSRANRSWLPAALLVAVGLVDLYQAMDPMEYNHPTEAALYTQPRPIHQAATVGPSFRMLSIAGEKYELADRDALRGRLSTRFQKEEVDRYLNDTRLKEITAPNVGMVFGLRDLDGYDGGLLPTRTYARLKEALLRSGKYTPDSTMRVEAQAVPDARLMGAFAVQYLLTDPDVDASPWGWEPVVNRDTGALRLYSNPAALPRAYAVHAADTFRDDGQMLQALRTVDLSKVVVLGEEVGFEAPAEPGADRVEIVRDGAGELLVDAAMEQPGFVVLSDSFYPGWRVYVDGKESTLLRADYAVRAVQVDAGHHQVRFVYDPMSLKAGLVLTLLGAVAACLAGAAGSGRSPRWMRWI